MLVSPENGRHVEGGSPQRVVAVVSTNLLAYRARPPANRIETLPEIRSPDFQQERCLEPVDQLAPALEELPSAALS